MTVLAVPYHVNKIRIITDTESDSSGTYICTNRGVFQMTELEIEMESTTVKILDLVSNAGSISNGIQDISPISRTVYENM